MHFIFLRKLVFMMLIWYNSGKLVYKLVLAKITKEELKTNTNKLHRTVSYQPNNTEPMSQKFKSYFYSKIL